MLQPSLANAAADLIISSVPRRDCSLKSRTHIIGQHCSRPYHFQSTEERLLSSQEQTLLANAAADLIISSLPRRDCSQVINIHNMHWCVTTNAGCKDGVIKVYDSMYDSLSSNVTGWPPTTPTWLTRLLNHSRIFTLVTTPDQIRMYTILEVLYVWESALMDYPGKYSVAMEPSEWGRP